MCVSTLVCVCMCCFTVWVCVGWGASGASISNLRSYLLLISAFRRSSLASFSFRLFSFTVQMTHLPSSERICNPHHIPVFNYFCASLVFSFCMQSIFFSFFIICFTNIEIHPFCLLFSITCVGFFLYFFLNLFYSLFMVIFTNIKTPPPFHPPTRIITGDQPVQEASCTTAYLIAHLISGRFTSSM